MIRRVLAWWLWKYGPDVGLLKEAARFGTKSKNAEAYDYSKARSGWLKARKHSATGRALPSVNGKKKPPAQVVQFRSVKP